MSPIEIGIIAIICMFLLILLHVPIGIAMAAVGVLGFGLLTNFGSAITLLASEPAVSLSSLDFAVIPLFVLMGNFATIAGISTDMYNLAYGFIGHRRGGLAMATIGGCGLFGAVCGSSIATTATFGQVALPEMLKKGYSPTLATGCIAGGGTLGSLVPPSIILVIYAVLSEEFIVDLFVAAIVPSIITILLYFVAIYIYVRLFPKSGPAGPRQVWGDRLRLLIKCRAALILVALITIGIYGGIFTVNEAAALGAILSIAFAIFRKKLTTKGFWEALLNTAITTGMIYTILIGSSIFNYFIVISHVPDVMTTSILQSGWSHFHIMLILLILYIFLGSIFDTVSAMVITLPFVLPLIVEMGYSPVWWGIINVVVVEIGMITPPMGLNVFMLQGILRKYPVSTIFKGILPFLLADFVRLAILAIFPILSLWLLRYFH